MAGINLPKISAPTAGEVGRLNPMKAPGAPKLVTYKAPKTNKTNLPGAAANPYDAFIMQDPYKASAIPDLANTSYASDVANDQKLAGMGYLTQAQRDAQAGNQATESTGIGAALAAQIAGIQQATVAQGNASGAALGAQNTATGSSGSGVAGLAGVAAPAGVSAPAVNAVLGTQNAATGNLYGGLQSAALASGAQNAKQAYANEAVNVNNDQQDQQKTLASLLSGLPSPSTRESTMTAANQTANAANTQSDLAIWTNLQNQELTDKTLNNKAAINRDDLANKSFLAGLSNTEKTNLAKINNQTKTTIANNGNTTKTTIANDANLTKSQIAAKNRAAANYRANQGNQTRLTVADISAGKKIAGAQTYAVTVKYPATTELVQGKVTAIPAKTKAIPINAAQWNAYIGSGPAGQRKLNRLGLPNGAKVIYAVKKS